MATFHAILTALIISHFTIISLTAFRLINQRRRLKVIWYDDVLAALTACGGAFTLGCLVVMVLQAPAPRPLEYHMVLVSYFFVIWYSRSCLIMTTARLLRDGHPRSLIRFSVLTWMSMNVGVTYTILAALLCDKDSDCPNGEACFCTLRFPLVLCALITDIIADIGLLVYNWYFFIVVVKEFKAHVVRRWLVYLGFSSSICTLSVNIVFWISYMTSRSDDYVLFICLSSAVTITSIVTANMSVIVGIVCRALRIVESVETQVEDTPGTQDENAPDLGPSRTTSSSLVPASGHTGHTIIKEDP